MIRVFKLFFMLVLLAGIGLIGFAYIGPILGADFAPTKTEIREPVTLDVD